MTTYRLPSGEHPAGVVRGPESGTNGPGGGRGPLAHGVASVRAALGSPAGGPAPDAPGVADHVTVQELRNRVSTRLTSQGGATYAELDPKARRQRTRTLIMEELQAWVLHRSTVGLPALSLSDEDTLIEAVTAALAGLGRLEPLVLRGDVEDIFFNGTAPTMLRLANGDKEPGPPIASSDEQLRELIQQLGSSLGDGVSREFSDARPLLALRLKSVGSLGARLSAVTDVTPHPAGTIRVHRHVEADLDTVYERGMIDAPLRALLRATVLGGAKVCFVGEMGAGKTFLLRSACAEIPLDRMIVTIEEERELGIHVLPRRDANGNVMRAPDGTVIPRRPEALVRAYEARPANSEGVGRVDQNDLLVHALRDSADVLVLGESRGGDIVHLLDAATNGTSGVMCTLHANSASAVFDRIVLLVRRANPPLPVDWALRACTALDLIVHVRRTRTHERFVSEVLEVASGQLGERGMPVVHHLFSPRPDGRAVPTGHKPSDELMAKLADVGFSAQWLDPALSDWDRPIDSPVSS